MSDVILVKNFEIFGFVPDVVTEEIKYLNENGVKIISVDEGELTPPIDYLNFIENSSK